MSYIVKGDDIFQDKAELDNLHKENMNKIANMSHEERLKEQQELMATLTEEQLSFLRSIRRKREGAAERGSSAINEAGSSQQELMVPKDKETGATEPTPMEYVDTGQTQQDENQISTSTKPPSCMEQEPRRVNFADDVEMKEESKADILESELPIPPSEAKKWLNMDKVFF